jgi:hypothetical protein
MAKATHGVDKGTFYFEIKVELGRKSHVRVGWSQILGEPEAPVGYDEYSYGIRDIDGKVFHCSISRNYAVPISSLG